MIATYPEQIELETTEEPETDETLQPLATALAQGIGSQVVPISFEVVGARHDSPRHNQYAYATEVLFNNMDPDFVSIGEVPNLSEDEPDLCFDAAAVHGDISKIVPVVTIVEVDKARSDEQFDASVTMNRYRGWGIEKVLVQPHQIDHAGETMWMQNTAELIQHVRAAGPFDTVGVIVNPERTASTASVGEDYDRIAGELSVADFGITQFLLNPAPYIDLVRAMRERQVTTPILPGIKPFRQYHEIKTASQTSNVSLGEELMHIMPPSLSRSDILRQSDELMSYFIGVGFDLVKHIGAPGLHIYTDNNVRTAQRLAQGVQQAINSL